MKHILILSLVLISLISSQLQAQENIQPATNSKSKKMHGNFYLTWGYQRNSYSKSDIRFINHNNGYNYDFTVHNAKAHDQPDLNDIFHSPISVPQYVFHVGYLFNDKHDLGVELGWDHLKYVVTVGQTANVTGYYGITQFNGNQTLDYPFFHFEHTNGNNYLMASLVKRQKLFTTKNGYLRISALGKFGMGGLVPMTNSTIMGQFNDDHFKLSGFVTGLFGGIRVDLLRYFYLEASVKGAFADYTSALIHDNGKAKQTFWSAQYIAAFGFNVPLSKE